MRLHPMQMGYLTEEMVVKAEKELNETKAVREKAILEIRKLMQENKDITWRHDDDYVLSILRARKFNVNRALTCMVNTYTNKKTCKDVCSYDFTGLLNSIRNQMISIMPYRDEDGSIVFVFKLENWNLEEKEFFSVCHDGVFLVLYCIDDPATQVCGIKLILDVRSMSLSHITHIHPKYMSLMARAIKDCLPIRLKEVHVITDSNIIYYFWNLMKFILTRKIKKRFHFHSAKDCDLTKSIARDVVPVEYGGNHHIDNEKLFNTISTTYESRYRENLVLGYAEE